MLITKKSRRVEGLLLLVLPGVVACTVVADIPRDKIPMALVSWFSGALLGIAGWCLPSVHATTPNARHRRVGLFFFLILVACVLRMPFVLGWWK